MIKIEVDEDGKLITMCGVAKAGDIQRYGLVEASKR